MAFLETPVLAVVRRREVFGWRAADADERGRSTNHVRPIAWFPFGIAATGAGPHR